MFEDIFSTAEAVLTGERIPKNFRCDVNAAKILLAAIKTKFDKKSIHHELSSDVFALARWAKVSFFHHDPNEIFSEVIENVKAHEERTYDLTVPNGSSYVINGMICHNTTNLPSDVTTETVEKLCTHAWETGCKGVTIYRIGSRDAVIVKETTVNGQPFEVIETQAPKRPKELECDINRVSIKGDNYLVIVGLLNNRPYEVFAGLSQHVEVPKKFKKGILIKNGKKEGISTYNLRIPFDDDELLFKDVVNLFDNPEHGALTRMISLSMRHGVPVQFLTEQLKKDKHSDLQSFSNVIARVLKSYIKDGTSASSTEKKCPNCDNETLIYQQGCVSCVGGTMSDGSSCTWSKC
jgi:hypothetical protein